MKGGSASDSSNVFCSAVTFINFLSLNIDKQPTGFFQPRSKHEYLTSADQLRITVETNDFWHVIDPELRKLVKAMLNACPKQRIGKKALCEHPYLSDICVLAYYDLCEMWSFPMQRKLSFLRLLQQKLHLFETEMLKRYYIPVLTDYLRTKEICHEVVSCLIEALNRCSLIETAYF